VSASQNDSNPIDALVVGCGIGSAAIARDAVGRGLSMLLVERADLAAHASSAGNKLIHGGLCHPESGATLEFRIASG